MKRLPPFSFRPTVTVGNVYRDGGMTSCIYSSEQTTEHVAGYLNGVPATELAGS